MIQIDVAILAGGCFWGVEDLMRQQPGIINTIVGYTGGTLAHPTYEDVKTGQTGHAEAIQIEFDPSTTNYEDILRFFFKMHDPTTLNRQGNDVGSQYRSAIFYCNDEQKRQAEQVILEIETQKQWTRPIMTTLEPAGPFYPAESYHQQYLQKNPGGYTCHYVRE